MLIELGGGDRGGGAGANHLLSCQELEEGPHGGKFAGNRSLLLLALVEASHESAHRKLINSRDFPAAHSRRGAACFGQVIAELPEVARIIADSVRGSVALDAQVTDVTLNPFVHFQPSAISFQSSARRGGSKTRHYGLICDGRPLGISPLLLAVGRRITPAACAVFPVA